MIWIHLPSLARRDFLGRGRFLRRSEINKSMCSNAACTNFVIQCLAARERSSCLNCCCFAQRANICWHDKTDSFWIAIYVGLHLISCYRILLLFSSRFISFHLLAVIVCCCRLLSFRIFSYLLFYCLLILFNLLSSPLHFSRLIASFLLSCAPLRLTLSGAGPSVCKCDFQKFMQFNRDGSVCVIYVSQLLQGPCLGCCAFS